MEIRDIEIFLTLAEELHFGRTAARLHVSVARVSQAIKKQERAIGALLFDRDNRTVRLTTVGAQLRDDLLPVRAGLEASLRRARLSATGKAGALRVGSLMLSGYDLERYWVRFRDRYPQWNVQLSFARFVDPFAGLRGGDLDILIAWLPIEEPDLTVGPTITVERRVLGVAADHELSVEESASPTVLRNFCHPTTESAPEYWGGQFHIGTGPEKDTYRTHPRRHQYRRTGAPDRDRRHRHGPASARGPLLESPGPALVTGPQSAAPQLRAGVAHHRGNRRDQGVCRCRAGTRATIRVAAATVSSR
ncbi:LysR family transcriptional regulator [Nocardia wallacei]|uniref:LysR family transcriptional regulator n=1 Tax=Nocardia wallacei TaxID=480035 RepID=UPI0024566684|nr:LysR family transcriptional regulator [Nocardia wallacei]